MTEFEKARQRAEKNQERRGTLHLPQRQEAETKPVEKAPKKRSNEITVSVWVDGEFHTFDFTAPISGSLLAGQKRPEQLRDLIRIALASKLGSVCNS